MYAEPDFKGQLILKKVGPFIIYNNFWVNSPDRFAIWDNIVEQSIFEFDYETYLALGISNIWVKTQSENNNSMGYLPKVRDGSWLNGKGMVQSNVSWSENSFLNIGSFKIRDLS